MPLLPLLAVPDLPPPRRERELVAFERELVFRDELAAEPDDLRAVDERLEPLPDDFAPLADDFFAVERDVELFDAPALERFAVEREPVDFRFARGPDDLRPPAELEALEEAALPLLADVSALHLPDMTRCAASATASAINDPNLVALATTFVAACEAVSAASSPASRIFLRAAGLAAIAAAAAVKPAASISLLIAAFASLSTVAFEPKRDELPVERDEDEPTRDPPEPADEEEVREEEVLRVDLAIFLSPSVGQKTL